MSLESQIIALTDNLRILDHQPHRYLGVNLEVRSKKTSTEEKKTICVKIEKLIKDFLSQADLYDEKVKNLLVRLKLNMYCLTELKEIKDGMVGLDLCINFIRENRITKEYLLLGGQELAFREKTLPPKGLHCTIIIDDGLDDKASKSTCLDVINDKMPMLITSRTYASLLPNKCLEDQYLILQHTSNIWVICFPKQPGFEAPDCLKKYGFATSALTTLLHPELFVGMPQQNYLEMASDTLPTLFTDKNIPKRFHIVGHGSSGNYKDTGSPSVCGLTISQLKGILQRLEYVGMDYVNFLTCFGGKNVRRVLGGITRKFTASICSVDDVVASGRYETQNKFLTFRLHNIAKFWFEIANVLNSKKEKAQAKDFKPALESIYGLTWACTPLISIAGSSDFKVVKVHDHQTVISHKKAAFDTIEIGAKKNLLLVYPPLIQVPVRLHPVQHTGRFPNVISLRSHSPQVFFSKIITTANSPLKVIQESFLKEGWNVPFDSSETQRLYVVKELVGEEETFLNLVASFHFKKGFALFQKLREPEKWFILVQENRFEREISECEALVLLYEISQELKSSQEQSLLEHFLQWFQLATEKVPFLAVLDMIDREVPLHPVALNQNEYLTLLFYATEKKKWEAFTYLCEKVQDFDQMNVFGKKLLHLMVARGDPQEKIAFLLDKGAPVNGEDGQRSVPLYYAIQTDRLDLIELLVRRGATTDSMPFVLLAVREGKIALAQTLVRDYHFPLFGFDCLTTILELPEGKGILEISLNKLRQSHEERDFYKELLAIFLRENLFFSWNRIPAETKNWLIDQSRLALTHLVALSEDLNELYREFLCQAQRLPEADLVSIVKPSLPLALLQAIVDKLPSRTSTKIKQILLVTN